jgi:hypothetical protein
MTAIGDPDAAYVIGKRSQWPRHVGNGTLIRTEWSASTGIASFPLAANARFWRADSGVAR